MADAAFVMRGVSRPCTLARSCVASVALVAALALAPRAAPAQTTDQQRLGHRLAATPIGALPPSAMPMPASRNHNYWTGRVQVGVTRDRGNSDQFAIAGGVDLQWRGGSVFGVTAGYQTTDCDTVDPDCGNDHALFGARARLNIISGGPTIGALLGDFSATTTLGTELGFGYAPGAVAREDVCTFDLGVPISHAMLHTVRLVAFISPGIVWDIGCAPDRRASRANYLTNVGIGVQQLGGRALDVHAGAQKIFRSATGYVFGISITYTRMP